MNVRRGQRGVVEPHAPKSVVRSRSEHSRSGDPERFGFLL
jgi:hypothetical protein